MLDSGINLSDKEGSGVCMFVFYTQSLDKNVCVPFAYNYQTNFYFLWVAVIVIIFCIVRVVKFINVNQYPISLTSWMWYETKNDSI